MELGEFVESNQLAAIYKTGENKDWFLVFTTPDYADLLGSGRMLERRDGMAILVDRIDVMKTKGALVPHALQEGVNRCFPLPYGGSNVRSSYETQAYEGGANLKTGVIRVEMNSTVKQFQDIPYMSQISGRTVLITVLGRHPQCLKCGGRGIPGQDVIPGEATPKQRPVV